MSFKSIHASTALRQGSAQEETLQLLTSSGTGAADSRLHVTTFMFWAQLSRHSYWYSDAQLG